VCPHHIVHSGNLRPRQQNLKQRGQLGERPNRKVGHNVRSRWRSALADPDALDTDILRALYIAQDVVADHHGFVRRDPQPLQRVVVDLRVGLAESQLGRHHDHLEQRADAALRDLVSLHVGEAVRDHRQAKRRTKLDKGRLGARDEWVCVLSLGRKEGVQFTRQVIVIDPARLQTPSPTLEAEARSPCPHRHHSGIISGKP